MNRTIDDMPATAKAQHEKRLAAATPEIHRLAGLLHAAAKAVTFNGAAAPLYLEQATNIMGNDEQRRALAHVLQVPAAEPAVPHDEIDYTINYSAMLMDATGSGKAPGFSRVLLRNGGDAKIDSVLDSQNSTDPRAIQGKINADNWFWNIWGRSFDGDTENDIIGLSMAAAMMPEKVPEPAQPWPCLRVEDIPYSTDGAGPINYLQKLKDTTGRGIARLRNGAKLKVFVDPSENHEELSYPIVSVTEYGKVVQGCWSMYGRANLELPAFDPRDIVELEPDEKPASFADMVIPGMTVVLRNKRKAVIAGFSDTVAGKIIRGNLDNENGAYLVWLPDGRQDKGKQSELDIMHVDSFIKGAEPVDFYTAVEVGGVVLTNGGEYVQIDDKGDRYSVEYPIKGTLLTGGLEGAQQTWTIDGVRNLQSPGGKLDFKQVMSADRVPAEVLARITAPEPVEPAPTVAEVSKAQRIEQLAKRLAQIDGYEPTSLTILATPIPTLHGVCLITGMAGIVPVWERYVERATDLVNLITE